MPDRQWPGYIVVEGPIGVGKTTLASRLAETLGRELLLERAGDNPFLPRFYENPRTAALPTQLHFLFQRARMLETLRQGDLFRAEQVSDFLVQKDELFARATLDPDELELYYQVYNRMALDSPAPDLVIYLQAQPAVLVERVRRRAVRYEREIGEDYLERLADGYARFFYHYDAAPLLIVNSENLNFVERDSDFELLVSRMRAMRSRREFFNLG